MAEHKHTNRLVNETSPYLLQHAHNPVDWYAWGPEAFEAARQRNCPVFLSVGYSTCYWCHVMERESFEDEAIAEEMNRRVVSVKVDREERPDIDQLYMLAVQLMTRQGGWPMSVFLTPDGRPFYGGTYFPPEDLGGRPGFPTLVQAIAHAWEERREEVEESAGKLTQALERLSLPGGAEMAMEVDQALIDTIVGRSISDYDPRWGGFGGAPKFPRETLLELLLAYCEQEPRQTPAKAEIRPMMERTLEMMARGGIRDHLGGAFHRYSVDERWLVPHFEIMLYDNAMLLQVYAEASRQLGREDFAKVARGIAEFVIAEMTGPAGEFCTAFDAEVDGKEGDTYLWTARQVQEAMGDAQLAAMFNEVYGLGEGPNFADPHHGTGEPDRNVLFLPMSLAAVAEALKTTPEQLEEVLEPARRTLLEARKKRKQPLLDTKVLTSWNALMIRGLSFAGRVLREPRYVEAAQRAAEFLLREHRMGDGGLYRSSREGKRQVTGFVDDYAYLAQGLLELERATGDARWRMEAEDVVRQMVRRFSSPVGAMYFTDASSQDLIVRQMVASDSPLPSGNAVAARVLMELGRHQQAMPIIVAFADALDTQGEAYSAMVQAAMEYVGRHGAVEVPARDMGDELEAVHKQAQSAVKVAAERVDNQHLRVHIGVEHGYHINASDVGQGLVPTRVFVQMPDGGKGEQAGVEYPPASSELVMPDGARVGVYDGPVEIDVRLPEPCADPVRLLVQVQPCSSDACLEARRIEASA